MHQAEEHKLSFRGACPDYFGIAHFSRCNIVMQRICALKSLFCKKISLLFLSLFFILNSVVSAQTLPVDKKKFFTDERLIEMTLVADF